MSSKFDINNHLVTKETKISEVIKVLQENDTKITIVISEDRKLLGSITDGDIRRGLLEGFNIDDNCELIMNNEPSHALKDDQITINRILKEKKVSPIIVDKYKKVLTLYSYGTSIREISKPNKIVIMAGGKGERLMPLTEDTPKPLLTIKDKPIIEYIVEGFVKNGFHDITLSVGYKSEKLVDYFNNSTFSKNITYITESTPLDTAGSLSLLSVDKIKDPIIVKNGDIITNVNYDELLNFHNQHNKSITVCASEYKVSIPFGSIKTINGVISNITEKPTIKHHINAGIYVINPDIIKNMKHNIPISMIDLLNKYIKTGNVIAYPLYESWIDIGSPEDFKNAQKNEI
tara:strand:- start:1407 stop:2444 length:1038 start_codon:yes stop_codon:yes gene_type:complete